MHVFFIFRARPEERIEIRLIPGGYLVKPVFQVAAGMWACKAHGHSPAQRGQMAEEGCLCGCSSSQDCQAVLHHHSRTELLQRGATCPNCSSGFASLSSA